jgi:hypothetical protein
MATRPGVPASVVISQAAPTPWTMVPVALTGLASHRARNTFSRSGTNTLRLGEAVWNILRHAADLSRALDDRAKNASCANLSSGSCTSQNEHCLKANAAARHTKLCIIAHSTRLGQRRTYAALGPGSDL